MTQALVVAGKAQCPKCYGVVVAYLVNDTTVRLKKHKCWAPKGAEVLVYIGNGNSVFMKLETK